MYVNSDQADVTCCIYDLGQHNVNLTVSFLEVWIIT